MQSAIALISVTTSSFQSIVLFSGFILGLNTVFAVGGIFVLRWRQPDLIRPYRTWLYPLPPIIYLVLMFWTLVYTVKSQPQEALIAAGLIGGDGLAYRFAKRYERKRS